MTVGAQRARSWTLLPKDLMHFFVLWRNTGSWQLWKPDHGRLSGHALTVSMNTSAATQKSINIPGPGDASGNGIDEMILSSGDNPQGPTSGDLNWHQWTFIKCSDLNGALQTAEVNPQLPAQEYEALWAPDPVIDRSIKRIAITPTY